MKGLILCVCVVILALSSSTELKQQRKNKVQNTFESNMETCMTEVNITLNELLFEEYIVTGIHPEPENHERARKNGCLIACLMKKINLMEGTDIKESNVHAKLDEMFKNDPDLDKVHTAISKCLREARSITDECEKGVCMYKCVKTIVHDEQEHEELHKPETKEETEQAE